MESIPKLRLIKRKIVKEDGRYLVYFTFEEEDESSKGDGSAADCQIASLPASLDSKSENGR